MGTQTKNNLGIQKQFTARPDNLYQKNLTGINGDVKVEAATSSEKERLGQALGILGKTYDQTITKKHETDIKVGEVIAKAAFGKFTLDEWKNAETIRKMQEAGFFDHVDNKYAVAMIDRLRGQAAAKQINDDFDLQLKTSDLKNKTIEEQKAVRQAKLQAGQAVYLEGVMDKDSFNGGWNESVLLGDVQHSATYRALKEEQVKQDRVLALDAGLDEMVKTWNQMTPEQRLNYASGKSQEHTIAGGTPVELVRALKTISEGVAQNHGDMEGLEELVSTLPVGVTEEGTARYAKDIVNLSPYAYTAGARAHQLDSEQTRGFRDRWKDMSADEVEEDWHRYQNTLEAKPQENARRVKDEMVNQKRQEEKQRARATANHMGKQNAALELEDKMYRHALAYRDQQELVDGENRALKPSDVVFSYLEYDSNGMPKEATMKGDDMMATRVFARIQSEIMRDPTTPEDVKVDSILRLYGTSFMSHIRETYTTDVLNSLDQLQPDNPHITPKLQTALDYHKHDPDSFRRLFNDDTANHMAILTSLAQAAGGDWNRAVSLYANRRDYLRDSDNKKTVEGKVDDILRRDSKLDFYTLDGELKSINLSTSGNSQLYKMMRTGMIWMDTDDYKLARTNFHGELQNSFAVYGDTVIPRSLFQNIPLPSSEQPWQGKRVLDNLTEQYAKTNMMRPQDVRVVWDNQQEKLRLTGGYITGTTLKSYNDIMEESTRLLELDAQEEERRGQGEKPQNTTLQDSRRERKNKEAIRKAHDTDVPFREGLRLQTGDQDFQEVNRGNH